MALSEAEKRRRRFIKTTKKYTESKIHIMVGRYR